MDEWAPFYDRYPNWSRMGRMVEDVSAAVDALQADAQVDPERIYLFGYAMGGDVALHAAALDPDISGRRVDRRIHADAKQHDRIRARAGSRITASSTTSRRGSGCSLGTKARRRMTTTN